MKGELPVLRMSTDFSIARMASKKAGLVFGSLILTGLPLAATAQAGTREITLTGVYVMGARETMSVVEEHARLNAARRGGNDHAFLGAACI